MKLSKHIEDERQFNRLVESSQLFRFINYYKDKETKMMDIYPFLEKLSGVLEHIRNSSIRKQISKIYEVEENSAAEKKEYSIELLEDIELYYQLDINQFRETDNCREVQLEKQIDSFCQAAQHSQTIQHQKQHQIDQSIEQLVAGLPESILNEWLRNPELQLPGPRCSQKYRLKILQCVFRFVDPAHMGEELLENLSAFIKVLLSQFQHSPVPDYL